jgi:hypothetical protein
MKASFRAMQYDCTSSGCFNAKHRPKFGVFADAFPGKISLTDVDATVEVNGRFLFIEFKSGDTRSLPMGQRIYFERLTALSERITCVVVCGDCETMQFNRLIVIHGGMLRAWEETNTAELFARITGWAKKALAPAATRKRN